MMYGFISTLSIEKAGKELDSSAERIDEEHQGKS
jgi:hypothetical protein